jgi:hypothetical protein
MREQWGKYMEFSGKMAFALGRTKTNIAQIKYTGKWMEKSKQ